MTIPVEEREEPVEVDQRGLIDKILARYSSKYAVFRELLQNADDASATKVLIRFETANYHPSSDSSDSHPNLKDEVIRWVINNNGTPFSGEDWDRLKVIANGNPNALKIGTFGVGFYSVFAVTEEPCVRSGHECGRFKWKLKKTLKGENQELSVFRSRSTHDLKPWSTSFELPVRANDLLSQRLDFGRFLIAALPFMSTIESISLHFDSTLLLHLTRAKAENLLYFPNPVSQFQKTPEFNNLAPAFKTSIDGIRVMDVRIDAKASRWFDSTDQTSSHNLQLWSASAKIQPNKDSRRELEKATKKSSLLESSEVQITFEDLNTERIEKEDLISKLTAGSKGHVYIGHATTQTTGFFGHLAGHFIPTVERELLDLENHHVKGWNEELLYVAGCLARAIYDYEMNSVNSTRNLDRFHHLLDYFTFGESNPHPRVSALLREAFFACTSADFVLLTPDGGYPAIKVRDYNNACKSFIQHLPMVDERASLLAKRMMGDRSSELLRPVTFDDLVEELKQRPLTQDEMISCLKWVTGEDENFQQSLLVQNRTRFLEAARLSDSGNLLKFSTILDSPPPAYMSSNFPLPSTTLPRYIAKEIPNHDNLKRLFQAESLLVGEWLTHICEVATRGTSARLFVDVCKTLSDHWQHFSEDDQSIIKNILNKYYCISTRQGLQAPVNAYLSDSIATTFPTLPIIDLEKWDVSNMEQMRTFLSYIGVQSKIELNILKTHITEWNNETLVQYFLGHDPSGTEVDSLKAMLLFTTNGNPDERRKAAELYAPNKDLERLGLTVLSWEHASEGWNNESKEAKLLFKIGLRKYPGLLELLKMASGGERQENALIFLLEHFGEYEDSLENLITTPYAEIAFIPVEGDSELATVSNVYINRECVSVGCRRVREDFRISAEKFKVQDQPSPSTILEFLKTKPPTPNNARRCFEYLLHRVNELKDTNILKKLRDVPFVPLEEVGMHRHVKPTECYLVGSNTPRHYKKLFTYVDFGTSAGAFLKECGAREIPNASEIAKVIFKNPSAFYEELDNKPSEYMRELRGIAHKLESDDQEGQLKEALRRLKGDIPSALLGCDYLSYHCMEDRQGADEFVTHLLWPEEVVIMDDELNSSAFQHVPDLYYAPKVLEELYKELGCKNLSELVFEDYQGHSAREVEKRNHPIRNRIKTKVLSRLSMFLARYKDQRRQAIYRLMEERLVVEVYDHIEVIKTLESPSKEITLTVKAGRQTEEEKYELWISETEEEKLDYFQMAYSILGYLYETPTSNICCLFMTLLISTDEQLNQRGYRVPLSPNPDKGIAPDREKPHSDILLGRQLSSYNIQFGYGQLGDSATREIDQDADSDFVAPIPKASGATKGKRWFSFRNKRSDSELDGDELQRMIQHAVSSDYGESANNTVSLREEVHNSSCGKLYCGKPRCISGMDKDLPYAVWGGKDADRDVLDADKKMKENLAKLFRIFIDSVLDPLVEIYGMKKERIRLLWDESCQDLAAFTLNTGIFLNMCYYGVTHRKKMPLHDQLIAWYHLLAHEMAHTFYPDHDANFELFCSRIREKYMVKLFTLPPLKRAVDALWKHLEEDMIQTHRVTALHC